MTSNLRSCSLRAAAYGGCAEISELGSQAADRLSSDTHSDSPPLPIVCIQQIAVDIKLRMTSTAASRGWARGGGCPRIWRTWLLYPNELRRLCTEYYQLAAPVHHQQDRHCPPETSHSDSAQYKTERHDWVVEGPI